MKNELIKNIKINLLGVSLLSVLFVSGATLCSAAAYVPGSVNCNNYTGNARYECELKDNFALDVTTNWSAAQEYYHTPNATTDNPITKKHYFVSGITDSHILNSYIICDQVTKGNNYYGLNPCGLDAKTNNDLIKSDNLDDDMNVNPPGQEFTVVASSSDSSGMKSVRIEWGTTTVGAPPTSWSHGQTCTGSTCKICREGTLCPGGYAVISPTDLSVLPNGGVNRLWFRVILTDNALSSPFIVGADTPATDPYKTTWTSAKGIPFYQDKYYMFAICNDSGCSGKCGSAPVINSASASNSNCPAGTPYTFNWTMNKPGQTEFLLNVYDATTNAVVLQLDQILSPAVTSASYSYTPPSLHIGTGGVLQPNRAYKWELRVKDNAAAVSGQDCKQWSQWYYGSFTTCSAPSCSISGISASPTTAYSGTAINFNGTISGNGITGYKWMEGATQLSSNFSLGSSGGSAPFSYTLSGSAGTRTFTLYGILSNGSNCQANTSVTLIVPSCTAVSMTAPASGNYGSTVSFSATPTGNGIAKYEWSSSSKGTFGAATYSGGTVMGSEALPASGTSETITFIARDSANNIIANCTTSKTISLTPVPCNASFSINPPAEGMITGKDIAFDASASSVNGSIPTTYRWKVDAIDPYRLGGVVYKTIYYNFPTSGSHSVTLTVSDSVGNSCSYTQPFTVSAPPTCTVDFTITPSPNQYYGSAVTFTGNSGFNSYKWDKIVGTVPPSTTYLGTSSAPGFTPTSPFTSLDGTSPAIKLTATDSAGAVCSAQHSLNLSNPPTSCSVGTITLTNTNPKLGSDSVNFSATVSGVSLSGYNWRWYDSASGQAITSGTFLAAQDTTAYLSGNFVFNSPPFNAGSSAIVLEVTNPTSGASVCLGNTPINFVLPVTCDATLSISCPGGTCYYGDEIVFQGNAFSTTYSGNYIYNWSIDGMSFSGAEVRKTFDWPGTNPHIVRLIVETDSGVIMTCDPGTITRELVLKAVPQWTEVAPDLWPAAGLIFMVLILRTVLLYL